MKTAARPLLSIAVPIYNEALGIAGFHAQLSHVVSRASHNSYEIIYCDDGSRDDTPNLVRALRDQHVKLICLSRNFGKESALSAAIHACRGRAIIMLDGDGQHPVELIPEFLVAWKAGAKVVVGMRSDSDQERPLKRLGSWLFYFLFNRLSRQRLVAGATDYRLIDHAVQQAFLQLPETDRITRGLIDWLGFQRAYVPITRRARAAGAPTYSLRKLCQLATNSFVSLSAVPLYIFGVLGIVITLGALLLGSAVFIEQIILRDPLAWRFTGTAMLGILILFLIGIVLLSQGIISLYLSHTHAQTKHRPLYIIDYDASAGIEEVQT